MKNPTTFITKDGVSDADLMRAARDMYEALLKVKDWLDNPNDRLFTEDDEDFLNAAIATARGES
jgi:hypothetical protein